MILGIDLSLTGTGLALLVDNPTNAGGVAFANAKWDESAGAWLALVEVDAHLPIYRRWDSILRVIDEWSKPADFIAIEGLAYGMQLARAQGTPELSGIVRYHLWRQHKDHFLIPPAALKKFVTGNGAAPKEMMLKETFKRWRVDIDDHNIADAYGLARFGAAVSYGFEGLPVFQQDVCRNFLNPISKAKKVKRAT